MPCCVDHEIGRVSTSMPWGLGVWVPGLTQNAQSNAASCIRCMSHHVWRVGWMLAHVTAVLPIGTTVSNVRMSTAVLLSQWGQ